MEISHHRPGSISFVDLAASDAGVQGGFYSEMMGWQQLQLPGGEYTMFFSDGKPVAGMLPIVDPERVTTQWSCYVTVLDATAVCGQAELIGGSVLSAPFDIAGAGRVAVISDPTDAAICVFEGWSDGGFKVFDEPGAPCWFEQMSSDAASAVTFYEHLFDWRAAPVDGLPFDYWTCRLRTTDAEPEPDPFAGIMQLPPDTESAGWQMSLSIHTDIDTFVERAVALGARVDAGPTATSFGHGAVLTDPAGARFGAFDRSGATGNTSR